MPYVRALQNLLKDAIGKQQKVFRITLFRDWLYEKLEKLAVNLSEGISGEIWR